MTHDLLGLTDGFAPKFVKRYANLHEEMARAFAAYIEDVPPGASPRPRTRTRSTRTSFGRSRANGTARRRTDAMRIHILGTGALACFFGARLTRVAEVTLLGTWTEGIRAIANCGIVLETTHAEESHPARSVRLGTPLDPGDLVLVLVKAWQTGRVAREVPALTARDGHVLTLQNGLGNVEKLGPRAILGVTEQGATLRRARARAPVR